MHKQSRCDYCADFKSCPGPTDGSLGYGCTMFDPVFSNFDPEKLKSILYGGIKAMTPPKGMKICSKCKAPKPADLEHFYKKSKNKDGLMFQCKACHNQYVKRNLPKQDEPNKETIDGFKISPSRVNWMTGKDPLPSKIVLEIDVTKHTHLYDKLKKHAENSFRTVQNQILFMISELANE